MVSDLVGILESLSCSILNLRSHYLHHLSADTDPLKIMNKIRHLYDLDSSSIGSNQKLLDNDLIDVSADTKKFPYKEYQIIGETAEIDKIINTCGFVNIDVADIESTLSKETTNYVVVGFGEGDDCMSDALKDAIGKLPIGVEGISKLLFNIWIPRNMPSSMKNLNSLTEFIKDLPKNIDVCCGCAHEESLDGQQAKVTLIAASK